MRFSSLPTSLISFLAITLIQPVSGGLIPDLLQSLEDLQDLAKRSSDCANPCGYYGQLCCQSNQVCYTDANNQAQCGVGGVAATQVAATPANGAWQYYTTTYVQTDLKTVTATFSSYVAAATATAQCSYAQGQTPCGTMCCLSGQYCSAGNTCVAVPGSSGYYSSLATVTVTNTAGGAATTVPFQTPVGTGGSTVGVSASESSGGLSGGAIAGIVIGVIAGIILLLLLCACCCAKGLIDGLLGIFGLGGRRRTRREEVEVIEERHHHAGGRTWYGAAKPSGTVVSEKKKKDSGLGGFAKAGLFLGGLAAILGLKRKRDERKDDMSSGYSYYDSEYYTSSSSSSSGARTRSRSRSRI